VIETFIPGGRRVRITRRFFARCPVCRLEIVAPDAAFPWPWTRQPEATEFVARHAPHVAPDVIRFEVEYTETAIDD